MRVIPFNKIKFIDYCDMGELTKVDIFLDVEKPLEFNDSCPVPHFSFDGPDAITFLDAYKKWLDY